MSQSFDPAVATQPQMAMSPLILDDKQRRQAFNIANLMFNPAAFTALQNYSSWLANDSGLVPEHFNGKPADILAVILQAEGRWGIDHVAVLQASFVLNGKLGYEGKLYQAVAKSLGGIEFETQYYGDWSKIQGNTKEETKRRKNKSTQEWYEVVETVPAWTKQDEIGVGIKIIGHYPNGQTKELSVDLVSCYPRHSTMWTFDPKTQIHYAGVKRFLRIKDPAYQMGIPDYDDLASQQSRKNPEVEINPRQILSENLNIEKSSKNIENLDDIVSENAQDTVQQPEKEPENLDDILSNITEDDGNISKYQQIKDLLCDINTKEECSSYRADIEKLKNNGEISIEQFDDLKKIIMTIYNSF